ncbi:MAG: hypothetical protein ACLQBL_23740 [Polyangiaceae bacterium]
MSGASAGVGHTATGGARLRAAGSAVRTTAVFVHAGQTRTSMPDKRKKSSRQSTGATRPALCSRDVADGVSNRGAIVATSDDGAEQRCRAQLDG